MTDTHTRPAERVLRDLAAVDDRLRATRAEAGAYSGTEDIGRLEKDVTALRLQKVERQRQVEDVDGRLQRLTQDAAKLRARRRDDVKGLGAEVDVEGRRDLKHDLAVAERRLSDVEEGIRQEEQARDAAEAAAAEAREKLDAAVAALESARGQVAASRRELETRTASLQEHSDTLRAELPEQLRRRYERSERDNGVGAAVLAGSACRACFMTLDRASLATIQAAAADSPETCPECGTLLIVEK